MSGLEFVCRSLTAAELARLRAQAFSGGLVIEREGLSILGLGTAAVLPLPNGLEDPAALAAVVQALRAVRYGTSATEVEIAGSRPPADLLCAMGALKFLPGGAASLVLPAVQVISRAGLPPVALVTGPTASFGPLDDLLAAPPAPAEALPDAFMLSSARPHDDFLRRVSEAVGEVRSGRLDKVVMAREVVVEANRPFRQADLLERLRTLHPSCTTFALEGFIGATPELLVRRDGGLVESHPLAGTAPRSGDPEADRRTASAMLASDKERGEHRAVVDAIAAALSPVTDELEVPDRPEIVELRNVSHLGTRIRGRLSRGAGGELPTALEVLALIHPTPAVAGTPIDLALDYLDKAEDLDRDRYAGAAGWISAGGDGEWYLGIRCALVNDRTARLFAGVGIVGDSDPNAELAETQLKLQAFLAAAVRP
jgi:menaquinone-specific isochorismate synthase